MSSLSYSTLQNQEQSFSSNLKNYKRCIKCSAQFKNYHRYFSPCEHNFKICCQCYNQQIQQKMQNLQIITCPLCPAQMLLNSQNHSTFFNHLPVSDKLVIQQYAQTTKSRIHSMVCSVKGCGGKVPKGICLKCGQHYCVKCKQKQHPLQGCPSSLRSSSTATSLQNINKITCPECDFINQITQKDRKYKKKSCENKYCRAFICVQHRTRWSKNHENHHPKNERILQKQPTCSQGCSIY